MEKQELGWFAYAPGTGEAFPGACRGRPDRSGATGRSWPTSRGSGGGRCVVSCARPAPTWPHPARRAAGPPRRPGPRRRRRRGVLARLRPRQRAGRARRVAGRAGSRPRGGGGDRLPAPRVRAGRPAGRDGPPASRGVPARATWRRSTSPAGRTRRCAPAWSARSTSSPRASAARRCCCGAPTGDGMHEGVSAADRQHRAGCGRRRPRSTYDGWRWSTTSSVARCCPSAARCSGPGPTLMTVPRPARGSTGQRWSCRTVWWRRSSGRWSGSGRHRDRLLASGQHLKRGLLLYGPPGTGKTHTVRYLLGRTAGGDRRPADRRRPAPHRRGLLGGPGAGTGDGGRRGRRPDRRGPRRATPASTRCCSSCSTRWTASADDADVVFVLTTNRADLLEPALAARPGRVDQAVELGLPDADGPAGAAGALPREPRAGRRAPGPRWPRRPRGSPPRSSRSCCAGRR